MNMLRAIAVASIICAPVVYAGGKTDTDHCTAKINQLDSIERSEGAGQHGGVATDIRKLIAQAKEAREKGDGKGCLAAANRALSVYKNASK
ncbi:hypothetical protein [Pseudomonas sp. CCOS 191]|uniref:hypothetical protein n=1 Tax=Pseudomonas sp. CCOS 191 TaxID=1649877 RepID=UPI0006246591|nr:hypothetical protein [Pseudomonas sp. CCOS 191]CRI57765.1 putative secreted protein [Pseudomonas sp. CCOS 191]